MPGCSLIVQGYLSSQLPQEPEPADADEDTNPFARTGEIAIFANFTKFTGSLPALLLLSFQSFADGPPIAHGVAERDATYRLETDDLIMFSERCDQHAHKEHNTD